jgi:hypothetical protein
MPSQSPASGWDFSSVIDFIDLDPYDVGSPTLHPQTADRSAFLPEGGVGLGDFSKLYESLGMPIETAVASLPALDESELSNSDDAAPTSPAAIQTPVDEAPTGSAPSHSPTIHTANYMNKNQRRKARRQAEKVLQEQAAKEEDQLGCRGGRCESLNERDRRKWCSAIQVTTDSIKRGRKDQISQPRASSRPCSSPTESYSRTTPCSEESHASFSCSSKYAVLLSATGFATHTASSAV